MNWHGPVWAWFRGALNENEGRAAAHTWEEGSQDLEGVEIMVPQSKESLLKTNHMASRLKIENYTHAKLFSDIKLRLAK
jgi:hypothetical protein